MEYDLLRKRGEFLCILKSCLLFDECLSFGIPTFVFLINDDLKGIETNHNKLFKEKYGYNSCIGTKMPPLSSGYIYSLRN